MHRRNNQIHFCLSLFLILAVTFSQLSIPLINVKAQENISSGDSESWIAVSDRSNGIFILHPDGSELIQIYEPDTGNNIYTPSLKWSPDGQKLAYSMFDWESRRASIWIYSLGSESPQKLIDNSQGGFDWYPDSSAIIYDKYAERETEERFAATCSTDYMTSGPYPLAGLYKIDLSTGEDLLVVPAQTRYPLFNPDFSPDGTHILFQQHEWDSNAAYYNDHPQYVTTLSQPSRFQLLPGTLDDCDWSSDSKQIACGKWDDTTYDSSPIILFDTDGNEIDTILAADQSYNFQPLWSPLKNELVFSVSEFLSYADGPCFGGSRPGGSIESEQNIHHSFSDDLQKPVGPGFVSDWSPDGNSLLIGRDIAYSAANAPNIESGIYITDVNANQSSLLLAGNLAAWQPSGNDRAELEAEILKKSELIPKLESTSYTTLYGLETIDIEAFDEEAARDLISQLESLDTVPINQASAFQRLVLQEDAIADNLNYAILLSSDLGETTADTFKLFWGLGELAAGTSGSLQSAMLNTAFRIQTAFFTQFEDPHMREAAQESFDSLLEIYEAKDTGDISNLVAELIISDLIVRDSTPRYFQRYLDPVQLEIEKGVQSVENQGGQPWDFSGIYSEAELEAQRAKSIGQIAGDTAHEIYLDVQYRSQISDLLTTISDLLVNASGRSVTWLNAWAVLSRIPAFIVEMYQDAVLSNALACVTEMSTGVGELVFQPTGEFNECPQLADIAQLPDWFDKLSWNNAQQTWVNDSTLLQETIEATSAGIAESENLGINSLVNDFNTQKNDFQSTNHLTQTILLPPGGEEIFRTTEPIELELLSLDIELLAYEIALTAVTEDPDDQAAQQAFEISSEALLSRMASIPEKFDTLSSLPGGGQSAIPVITDAPSNIRSGENLPTEITLTIANAGSADLQSARLTASMAGKELQAVDLQLLPAGSTVQQQLSFTPLKSDQQVLLITISGGGRTDTIWVPVIIMNEVEGVEDQNVSLLQRVNTRWLGTVLIGLGLIFAIAGSIGLIRLRSQ